jgi:ASC-1-like (ASCH) protein
VATLHIWCVSDGARLFLSVSGQSDRSPQDFEELLAHEDASAIAPDLAPEDLLNALRTIYPPEKESSGVVALEIKPGGVATVS